MAVGVWRRPSRSAADVLGLPATFGRGLDDRVSFAAGTRGVPKAGSTLKGGVPPHRWQCTPLDGGNPTNGGVAMYPIRRGDSAHILRSGF